MLGDHNKSDGPSKTVGGLGPNHRNIIFLETNDI